MYVAQHSTIGHLNFGNKATLKRENTFPSEALRNSFIQNSVIEAGSGKWKFNLYARTKVRVVLKSTVGLTFEMKMVLIAGLCWKFCRICILSP